jgi:hypothetical protein
MYSKWYSHIKDVEESKEFTQRITLAKPVLERLSKIIESRLSTANANHTTQYDQAAWAYKQADLNGYNRAMQDVLKYLED